MSTQDLKKTTGVWLNKSDLPNTDGFKFLALLDDGKIEVSRVIVRNGLHTVEGGIFHRIMGWRAPRL